MTAESDPADAREAAAPSGERGGNGDLDDDQATRIAVAAARAQAAARDRVRGRPDAEAPLRYVGLVTRGIAFAIDAAVISIVDLLVGVAAFLTMNVLNLSSSWEKAIFGFLGVAFVVWSAAYFVTFWATTGQTPGNRLLQFRVVQEPSHQAGMPPRRAIVRLIGLCIAVLAFGTGILLILFNDRRRGFQDVLARTVVIEAPVLSPADRRRIAAMEAGVAP